PIPYTPPPPTTKKIATKKIPLPNTSNTNKHLTPSHKKGPASPAALLCILQCRGITQPFYTHYLFQSVRPFSPHPAIIKPLS
uniref:hypothetical protein n=1 Tax=Enterocloster clostridioformis TaxID=1531 RepID=UPI0033195199